MSHPDVQLTPEDKAIADKVRRDATLLGGGTIWKMACKGPAFDFWNLSYTPKEKDIGKVSDLELVILQTQPLITGGLTLYALGGVAAICIGLFAITANFMALLFLPILLWIPALFISRNQVRKWRREILGKYGLTEDALK